MAYSDDSKAKKKEKLRHKSDDSADSWCDLSSDLERQKSRDGNKSEILLSPSSLQTIQEPAEPKRVSVKLYKSSASSRDTPRDSQEGKVRNKFFRSFVTNTTINGDFEGVCHNCSGKQKEGKSGSHQLQQLTGPACDKCERNKHHNCTGNSHRYYRPHLDIVCSCNHCVENNSEELDKPYGRLKSGSPFLKSKQLSLLPQNSRTPGSRNSSEFGHDGEEVDQGDRMKNKLMSVWNNVKYGWTLKTKANFQEDSPIFLLGTCYHKRPEDEDPEPGKMFIQSPSMVLFNQDFQSRLWFTYRRDFPALSNTRYTTDCGWGCMLRSGQMMLSHAFVCHFLGRGWRVHNQTREQETYYRHIIQWFGDTSSDQCPFSVHRLAEIGKMYGKQPGEWYGPSSVAYILRDALNKAALSQPVLKDLCVYVAQDCTVYKKDIEELCRMPPRKLTTSTDSEQTSSTLDMEGSEVDMESEWRRSVIILIPVRLGGEEFNPIYSTCIQNLITQESCLGLIGGKPKHSLYFIGFQEKKLIYLDPHFCQDSIDTLKRDFKIESYHCFSPRKISLNKIDPSVTVGFYCKTREDFKNFVDQSEMLVKPAKGSGVYPMFVFSEGGSKELEIGNLSLSVEKSVRVRHVTVDDKGKVRSSTVDSEDYVLL